MGSHLEKQKPTGTSFLPTATAWDFSPPPPPPALPGRPSSRGGACGGEDGEKANLHGDALHSTASSSPVPPPHLESLTSPLPRVTVLLFICQLCPFLIPEGPVTKIPRYGLSLILFLYADRLHSKTWFYIRIIWHLLKVWLPIPQVYRSFGN